jgi:hypothetical protein
MATVLFTWELGGGLGHVLPYLPVIETLREKGHRVAFALRDVTRAGETLARHGVQVLQAPIAAGPVPDPIRVACTYADVLYNCGFHDAGQIAALIRAWRSLFDLVRPDLAVFDHSPTALLASRAHGFRKLVCGSGFTVPPDEYPLPSFREDVSADRVQLKKREDRVTNFINEALERSAIRPLERLGQLCHAGDVLLRTFAEVDHYRQRRSGSYAGVGVAGDGGLPGWPRTRGRRIFAYLKPFRMLPSVLSALKAAGEPALVYVDGLERGLAERYRSPSLAFAEGPADIASVAKQCDFAVLHGTHDTTVRLLLAGKPALHIPLNVEQGIMTRNVEKLGAGIGVLPGRARNLADGLERLVSGGEPFERARQFAERYRAHRPEEHIVRFLGLLER